MITMTFQKTLICCFVFTLFGFLAMSSVQADPMRFSNTVALQNSGNVSVNLFSNPDIILTGPQLSFLVDITGTLAPGETHSLLVTYTELGSSPVSQVFQIPAFGTIPPPFSQLFTLTSTNSIVPIIATLRIDILGVNPDFMIPSGSNAGQLVDSYTYTFKVSQPVPEPTTVALLATGLSGIAALRKRRRHHVPGRDTQA